MRQWRALLSIRSLARLICMPIPGRASPQRLSKFLCTSFLINFFFKNFFTHIRPPPYWSNPYKNLHPSLTGCHGNGKRGKKGIPDLRYILLLHFAYVNSINVLEDSIEFIILQKTKTSNRKKARGEVIKCVSSDIAELNVKDYVMAYLERTKEFRSSSVPNSSQLFLSWKHKTPVTKQTLARWLTIMLDLAGINTEVYKAHSYRGAGLSAAYEKGASLQSIMSQGNWTSTSTFKNFYCAPTEESDIGRLIINSLEVRL